MKNKLLIVASDYYKEITQNLIKGCLSKIKSKNKNVVVIKTPGTFEIPVVISKNLKKFDGFIALGCVIKGETPHFDFICNAVSNGIKDLNIKLNIPVIFGVLTDLNINQAIARSSGDKNKGIECAIAAIQMANL